MPATYQWITINRAPAAVAWVSLARPELHNAFNDVMIAELQQAFTVLGQDPSVRVIVLQGEGKSFCAGADLNWMQSMLTYTLEENVADAQRLADMLDAINTCPKPVIGRIHGAAFGGGVGLTSVCDLVVALDSVTFCLSEVKLGLLPAVISPFVLQKLSLSQARRYFVTAERFKAHQALAMGLVHEVVDSLEALDTQVQTWIEALLQNGPDAVRICKALIPEVSALPMAQTAALTTQRIAQRRVSAEGQEGMNAFLEKRPPAWIEPSTVS